MIKALLIKLVNENMNYWDEHLYKLLFLYPTTFKMALGYTPYKLVMVLHPLMSTKCTLLSLHGRPCNPNLIQVLMNCLHELEKLHE
jgi:hypothetical protein